MTGNATFQRALLREMIHFLVAAAFQPTLLSPIADSTANHHMVVAVDDDEPPLEFTLEEPPAQLTARPGVGFEGLNSIAISGTSRQSLGSGSGSGAKRSLLRTSTMMMIACAVVVEYCGLLRDEGGVVSVSVGGGGNVGGAKGEGGDDRELGDLVRVLSTMLEDESMESGMSFLFLCLFAIKPFFSFLHQPHFKN